ncbi:HRDC domain-containing protein [Desulfovibrio sp. OttesenSCG-928-G15]|nr:HRDC domain-containing protein [Desulfovibrio sp. OttesenSCG-928-G15]
MRAERTRLAQDLNVPPYVIFSDRTLREMSVLMPDSPERFLTISGVGEHKREAFGEVFIPLIARYREVNPEEAARADQAAEQAAPATGKSRRRAAAAPDAPGALDETKRKPAKGDSLKETERLLDAGLSVKAVAAERGLVETTIISHMQKLAGAGKVFHPEQFMDEIRLNALRECFAGEPAPYLNPVVEKSRTHPAFAPGGATYDEARLARILLGLAAKGD